MCLFEVSYYSYVICYYRLSWLKDGVGVQVGIMHVGSCGPKDPNHTGLACTRQAHVVVGSTFSWANPVPCSTPSPSWIQDCYHINPGPSRTWDRCGWTRSPTRLGFYPMWSVPCKMLHPNPMDGVNFHSLLELGFTMEVMKSINIASSHIVDDASMWHYTTI